MFAKQDLYQLKNWTAYSARNAKKVFTISQSSKNDIINEYKLNPEDVIVTYPGIKPLKNQNLVSMDILQKKFGIPKKFILFVGTIQPRKNIGALIEAFSKIAQKNKETDLVIVGKKGWLFEPIFKLPQKIQIENRVHFLDFVNDEDLASLYKNAICFVLPSLYEGFGLPVLEAMQRGCPVITSNVSSLPEAGGNAALYVDPKDTDDIAKKIAQLINDDKLRKDLIKKGYEHLKMFSWEKSAKETLSILEELAKK
jgi:glycosyltransferase involved in cell wall biosynthesis